MKSKLNPNRIAARTISRGFSLIELIAVIVLLGIIAGIVAPKVLGQADKGKWNATKVKLSRVSMAIEGYALDNGTPPNRLEDLINAPGGTESWSGPYASANELKDAWGQEYVYKFPGEHGDFDLMSYGADKQQGGERWNKDITSWE